MHRWIGGVFDCSCVEMRLAILIIVFVVSEPTKLIYSTLDLAHTLYQHIRFIILHIYAFYPDPLGFGLSLPIPQGIPLYPHFQHQRRNRSLWDWRWTTGTLASILQHHRSDEIQQVKSVL